MIWESLLDKTFESDILKKNINTPQFDRLDRRPETRAEEAKVENKKQQNTAANANIEAEKALTDTQKATLETEEAKNYAKEAKHSTEKAKVIFFFKSDKAIVNSNLMLNKLRPSQRSIKKQLKNKTNRRKISLNYQIIRSRNFKLKLEKSLDEVYCEHCYEEFED